MRLFKFSALLLFCSTALGQAPQWVEGFAQVEVHHNSNGPVMSRDFRGNSRGYMTVAWWTPGKAAENVVAWRTAIVPEKKATTFAFIAATSVLPSEFSRGPAAKLFVNGKYALTFSIGFTRDVIWREGEFELKYLSKRVEYPFASSHRQFELHGNNGIFHLAVPASAIEAGKPAVIKVELLPFEGWNHGWFAVKERRDVLQHSITTLEGELESLRQDMAAANQQLQILASQVYSDLVNPRKFEHHVIYANGFRHEHPADLIQLQNGELLLMTREGTEHISNDGDVVLVRSKDGGKTWSGRQVIASIKNLDEREGCGIQLRDGTIIVGVYYNALYRPDGTYLPNAERENRLSERNHRHLGAYIITSRDNGHSWSEPQHIDTKEMPYSSLEGPTDAPIELPDGSIVMGIIGYSPAGDKGNRAAVMIRSTDKGKTWKHLSTMANDPGGKLGGFMEPGIVRTKSGRIITALRNHGTDHAIFVTHSDDDGKTWVPVKQTAMIGHPVDLIQLEDGRVMATYGIRPGRHTTPGGVRACFSRDNGETWDIQTEVAIRSDFMNWDIGYPESILMPDGRVLTVYYYNLFNKYYVGGTFWKP